VTGKHLLKKEDGVEDNYYNEQGRIFGLTITVEGKEGKISFLAEIDEQPDRKIRIVVDKFEEKK
jgi:hypothetical protein